MGISENMAPIMRCIGSAIGTAVIVRHNSVRKWKSISLLYFLKRKKISIPIPVRMITMNPADDVSIIELPFPNPKSEKRQQSQKATKESVAKRYMRKIKQGTNAPAIQDNIREGCPSLMWMISRHMRSATRNIPPEVCLESAASAANNPMKKCLRKEYSFSKYI